MTDYGIQELGPSSIVPSVRDRARWIRMAEQLEAMPPVPDWAEDYRMCADPSVKALTVVTYLRLQAGCMAAGLL